MNKYIPIILGGVVVLAIGILGIKFFFNLTGPSKLCLDNTPTLEEGFSEYCDPQLNIAIQFPNGWFQNSFESFGERGVKLISPELMEVMEGSDWEGRRENVSISFLERSLINKMPDPENKLLNISYAGNILLRGSFTKLGETNIGGQKASEYQCGEFDIGFCVIIEQDYGIYLIEFPQGKYSRQDLSETEELILSSFRILSIHPPLNRF